MLSKKKDKTLGLCPFTALKKECSEKCMLFREGTYVNERTNETIPFKDCAFNIMVNNVEAMHNRSYMMQREVGDLKNMIGLELLQSVGMVQTTELIRQAEKLLKQPEDQVDSTIKIEHKDVKQITNETEGKE